MPEVIPENKCGDSKRLGWIAVMGLGVWLFASPIIVEAAGRDYYLSAIGNDQDNGSVAHPWASIQKVNSTCFQPGDRIFFEGGKTFGGRVYLNAACLVSGTKSMPITVASYVSGGQGRAYIDGGFEADSLGGIVLRDLIFWSSATSTRDGVAFYDLRQNSIGQPRTFIRVTNVDSTGFGGSGIVIGSVHATGGGYRDVQITVSYSYANLRSGIETWAYPGVLDVHQYIYVSDCWSFDNGYNGIDLGSARNATIERNLVFENGAGDTSAGGPNGIITYDSRYVVIQYNESYRNTTSVADGNGFALDRNTRYSVLQYNYSHDNDGSGIYLDQWPTNLFGEAGTKQNAYQEYHYGNIVRYNISENDGRKGYASLNIWGRVRLAEIYNNTFYSTQNLAGNAELVHLTNHSLPATYVPRDLHLRNNIFQTANNARLINADAEALKGAQGLLFQNNDYYSSGGAFNVFWNQISYGTFTAWRNGSGQEQLNGQPAGFDVDPGLTAPGAGAAINNPDNLPSLAAYQLTSTSPLIGAGLNTYTLFGVNPGSYDFYRNVLPLTGSMTIGAHQR